MNSDTIVPAGAVDRCVDRLMHDTDVGIVGPRLVNGEGRAELSFGRMISPLNEARQKILGRLYDGAGGPVVHCVERETRRERSSTGSAVRACSCSRSAAEAAGCSTSASSSIPKTSTSAHAVRARGYRVLFTPSAEIVHLRGRSRRQRLEGDANSAYRRSQIAFYEKHHPEWAPILKLYLRVRGKRTQ